MTEDLLAAVARFSPRASLGRPIGPDAWSADSVDSSIAPHSALWSLPITRLDALTHPGKSHLKDMGALLDIGDRSRAVASYVSRMGEIHGAFNRVDARAFEIINELHAEKGVEGDILEIGVYLGKSATLLGFLPSSSERLHLCDRFVPPSPDDPDFLPGTHGFYQPYGLESFLARFGEFHDYEPEMHVMSSVDLHDRLTPKSFRFIHIDGSHRREVLQSDVELAKNLLVQGGVVVFHSYRSMATLEVGASAWREVAFGSFIPICASENKLYLTDPKQLLGSTDLIRRLDEVSWLKATTPMFGDSPVALLTEARPQFGKLLRDFVPPALIPVASRLKRRVSKLVSRPAVR